MIKWEKSKCQGVEFYLHDTRKHGMKYDRYYRGRFYCKGQSYVSSFGWSSESWTEQKVFTKLQEYKFNAKNGIKPVTFKGEQDLRQAKEQQQEEQLEREEQNNYTVEKYFTEIFLPDIQSKKNKRRVKEEKQYFKIWIMPYIGKKHLKDISEIDGQRIKKKMLKAGRSEATFERFLITLKAFFNHAVEYEYIKKNPMKTLKKIKYDNKRIRFLSHEEADLLLDILKTMSMQVYEMAVVSLHCGLRAGEVFSLKGKDIDMKHGFLTLLNTKSGKTRTLSMTTPVRLILQGKDLNNKDQLIFPSTNGKKIKSISSTFSKAIKKAGFNDGITDRRQQLTFHSLRHTFASWLIINGLSIYELKSLLGHATIAMTERYSHLSPNATKKASNLMDKILIQNDNVIELDTARNA